MRQLIAGNWKMNGLRAEADALLAALCAGIGAAGTGGAEMLVCPPATLLHHAVRACAGSALMVGAQDCHAEPSGPHTGDVSAGMIRDAGAAWVIVGHSERRGDHGESDPHVRAKAEAAAAAGLTPIVCVGETEKHRLSGNAELIVASQVDGSLPADFRGVVAYEPVWAIGTGRTARPEDVLAMHAAIRAQLLNTLGPAGAAVRILYGGSVKPGNAGALLALPEVGGALVGGASLVADDFLAIARAAH